MRNVVNVDFTTFGSNKDTFVDSVLYHRQELFLVRNSNDKRETGSVTHSEDFVHWNGVADVIQGIVTDSHHSRLMAFYTHLVLIVIRSHENDIDDTIVQPDHYPVRNRVMGNANGFSRIPF